MKKDISAALFCVFTFGVIIGSGTGVLAQAPATGQERLGSDADRPVLPDLEPVERAPLVVPTPPDRPARQGGSGPAFHIDKVVIRGAGDARMAGSDKLLRDQLELVADEFEGKAVTVDDLLMLRDLLTSCYVENGYVNSGAVILPQDVRDGVFEIDIVEGELTRIVIDDLDALAFAFIDDRIRLAESQPLDINKLQERIQLLLTDPAIRRINAALGPGAKLGEGVLQLNVEEAPQHSMELEVANDRSPSVGAVRGSAAYRMQNVTGHSDPLALEIGVGEGLRDFSLSYSTPVNPKDVRIFGSASYSDSDVVEEPFNAIDVESESWSLALGVSHPIVKTLDDDVALDMSLERKRSTTFLLGRRFSFAEGVKNGRSNVTAWRLTKQWRHRKRDQALALRSTESIGLGFLGATQNEGDTPDGRFFTWLGQVQYARRLPWVDWQFALRGDVQLTPDALLPIERIAIGGATTVRGYRENQLVTDNGWVASAELRVPIWNLGVPGLSEAAGDGQISLTPFVDAGGGWNVETPDPDDELLFSAGGGLRWRISSALDLRLDVGVPIRDVPDPDDHDLQDYGVHFGLSARLFGVDDGAS